MPKGLVSIAGEVVGEATGNKNVRTGFEIGESVITLKLNSPTKLLEAGTFVLAGQAAVTVKNTVSDNNQNSSTNNNSTDKNNNTKSTTNKSSSSQGSNANSPISPQKKRS